MKKIFFLISFITFTIIAFRCTKAADISFNNSGAAAPGNTGTGGSLARFTIVGNYLYTVDKSNLKVFSITDAANPVLKSTVPVGFEIETIYPFKDKLFIGSTSQVYIFSITNPEQPQKLSVAISPEVLRRCDPVVAKDSIAYATLRTNGPCGGTQSILAVYNITDITHPRQVATFSIAEPYGLGYADTSLYVCNRLGLYIFHEKPGTYLEFRNIVFQNEAFIDVIPYNNRLVCWVRDGLLILDNTNRNNPALISKII